jgi:hypothetical protein
VSTMHHGIWSRWNVIDIIWTFTNMTRISRKSVGWFVITPRGLEFYLLPFVVFLSFFWPLSFFDLRILITPLVSSNSSYNLLLSFFLWPLWCLFFELRILITPLVSSNSSYASFTNNTNLLTWAYLMKVIPETLCTH